MANKNDLSAYKSTNHETLKTPTKPQPAKRGRGVKPVKEKRSYKTLLSLTEAEGAMVETKAGMVPVATYLMSVLRKAGTFD